MCILSTGANTARRPPADVRRTQYDSLRPFAQRLRIPTAVPVAFLPHPFHRVFALARPTFMCSLSRNAVQLETRCARYALLRPLPRTILWILAEAGPKQQRKSVDMHAHGQLRIFQVRGSDLGTIHQRKSAHTKELSLSTN